MKKLGHRGCIKENAPYQNSLEAFKLAIKHSDGFETDACLSKNGDIFFIHEAKYASSEVEYSLNEHLEANSIKKVGHKRLDQLSSIEIKSLKLLDGQPIPTWDKTIALFKGQPNKIFNIELKSEHVADSVINKLKTAFNEKTLVPSQVIISSINHPSLIKVRNELASVKIGALFIASRQKPSSIFPWSDNTESMYIPFSEQSLKSDLIHQIKPEFIIMPHTELQAEQMNHIKQTNPQAKAIVWVFSEWPDFNKEHFKKETKKYADDGILDSIIIDELI